MISLLTTRRKLAFAGVGAAVSLTAIACGTANSPAAAVDDNSAPTATPEPPTSSIQSGYDAVRQSLQADGAVIVRLDDQKYGIFDNPYTEILVNGEKVDLYEFTSVSDALKASLTVSKDGMTISPKDGQAVAIDFLNPPHYYLQGNVIAVYSGTDLEVIGLLRSRLGAEFAGQTGITSTPQVPGQDYNTTVVDAPIDDISVGTDPDNPNLYVLNISSGLPGGCAKFEDWSIDRVDDTTFRLHVLNRVPAPGQMIACTDIYGINKFTAIVGEVGKDLKACLVYKVDYTTAGEEKAIKFQAIAPNVRCQDPTTGSDNGGSAATPQPIISDVQALLLSLKSMGMDVTWDSSQSGSDLFGFTSSVLMVNGERVEVWSFGPGGAMAAAQGVSPDGRSIDNGKGQSTMYEWISPPSFYLSGTSIILYVGDNQDVLAALDKVGGQKFAGVGSTPIATPIPTEPDGGIGDGAGPIDPTQGSEDGTPTPRTVLAPIVSVGEVSIAKSNPPQYLVNIRTAQPDGCHKDAGYEVKVAGTEVQVNVYNTAPGIPQTMMCTMIYGETDHLVNLGSDFKTGVEYTLIVNGEKQGTFTGS